MKVLLLIVLLLSPLHLFPSGLTFSGNSVGFSSEHLSLSYPDLDFSLSYGGFRYGKLSFFELSELIRPDLSVWEEKSERRKDKSLKGFSWKDDTFAVFLSQGSRTFAGSSVRMGDFRFSFLLYTKGERGDELLAWASERGGERGESVALSYMGDHFLARSVFYITDESGINAFLSAGLSWNGVTLTYSRGRITAFEEDSSLRREVVTLDFSSGGLKGEYTFYRGHDPFIGGTYRPHGMKTTVLWKDDAFYLRSDFERVFGENGKYTVKHTYETLFHGCGIRFTGKGDPVYVFSHDGIRIESDLKSFSVSASLKGPWWAMRLGFTSERKITTSVSLSLP